jgi:hypothetical protein
VLKASMNLLCPHVQAYLSIPVAELSKLQDAKDMESDCYLPKSMLSISLGKEIEARK